MEKNNTPDFVNSSHKEFQDKYITKFLADEIQKDLKTGRRRFLEIYGL